MPSFTFSQALTANQLGFNPISDWQYNRIPQQYVRGAAIKLIARATGVSVRLQILSGGQTIQERSPVQGGGTAGTTPSELNTSPITWVAGPGDKLKFAFDEVGGLTPTVDGVVFLEPL